MVSIVDKNLPRIVDACKENKVKRLELFGSAANGEFDYSRSDFDFLVEFESAQPIEHADRYFAFLDRLRRILERPVDLIETKAIRNPYFKKNIESSRIVLYGA
jgi:uncharacterized protein